MEIRTNELPEGREAREALDKLVSQALRTHTKTHMQIFGYPTKNWEELLQEAIVLGYYNGKTITYNTPMGTITLNAKVSGPKD